MPDTKITRTTDGWIDVDQPTIYHKVRRLAREARRQARGLIVPQRRMKTTQATVVGVQTAGAVIHAIAPVMETKLQARALDRMVKDLGVDFNEAYDVVLSNGYNKSVSYAHMRKAGATHHEALIVIGLDNPHVSYTYGTSRQIGMNHTDALAKALEDDD